MPRVIAIRFRSKPDTHRLRNFAEGLSLALDDCGWGRLPMAEADAATIDLFVRAIPSSKLRRTTAMINTMLDEHGLRAEAIVSSHTDFRNRQGS